MTPQRLAYTDPDSAETMAQDASACRAEAHLAKANALLAATRRTVEQTPSAALGVPRQMLRTAVSVSDSAAKFAGRLFD